MKEQLKQKIESSLLLTQEKKQHWLARAETFSEDQCKAALEAFATSEQELQATLNALSPEKIEQFQQKLDAIWKEYRHAAEEHVRGNEESSAEELLKNID